MATIDLSKTAKDTSDLTIDVFATLGASVAAAWITAFLLPGVPFDEFIPGAVAGIVGAVTWRRMRRDNV